MGDFAILQVLFASSFIDMLWYFDNNWRSNEEKLWNFWKAIIRALTVQTAFYSPIPPLKQDRSKTNYGPDTSQAHISQTEQFLSVRFESRIPKSERYRDSLRPQEMKFTCLVELQIKHKPSKSEC